MSRRDWNDNPHGIKQRTIEKEHDNRKRPLGACVLCGDARFTGNNRGEQPRCMNVRECQIRQRQRAR